MSQVHMNIDQGVLKQLQNDLKVRDPLVVRFDYGFNTGFAGLASPDSRIITITMSVNWYDKQSLAKTYAELKRIFLHEIRHFHQFDNWPQEILDDYEWKTLTGPGGATTVAYNKKMEDDADDFAEKNKGNYVGLFKIRRRTVSKLSRISEAERRSRLA